MGRSEADPLPAGGADLVRGTGIAVARAIVMLVVAFVMLAVFPNWLLGRLATRVTATGRDLILAGWTAIAFVGSTWLFVRLQGGER